ncbi:MAG: M1 family metallopeptidase [Bacteroidales bacterium]
MILFGSLMPKKEIYLAAIALSFSIILEAQIVLHEPLSQRLTGYKIDAVLNTAEKKVAARMKAFWVNNSNDIVPDIRLHMYLNAFSNNNTTFYKESGGSPGGKKEDPGWIKIVTLSDDKGTDLTSFMKYISPDDGNPFDRTVLQIILPEPVRPGDTIFLDAEFESKLPSTIRRTGYNDDFYFVAQWFPKFGVYEPAGMRYSTSGGWNCHQFHSTSEFFSNHSIYDVTITLPDNYVVGTGGLTISEKDNRDGTKTLVTRAEDIVDYAWTASPEYAVYNDRWKNVDIKFLSPPERKDQVQRHLTAVKYALEYLDANVGPYPWPHLTFVDPPSKGSGAGGMEYTTLFTTMSFYGLPGYLLLPEMVTVHEFGHAYFMGILASNEFEEPWLDEGVNSYWEERIMDHFYGDAGMINHPLIKLSDRSIARTSYVLSPSRQAEDNSRWSWDYPHNTYNMLSYQKAATWLHTLTGIIGEESMNEVFREYYRQWAFKHPSGKDFIDVFNKIVPKIYGDKFGENLNWFFKQTLYGTGICDYKVVDIINRKIRDFEGVSFEDDSAMFIRGDYKNDSLYISTVELQRDGEIILPVEVLVHFDDGTEKMEHWDGSGRVKDFTYTGTTKIQWAKIDPEYKNLMDVDFINNSITLKPDNKPVRIIFRKLTLLLLMFIDLISI